MPFWIICMSIRPPVVFRPIISIHLVRIGISPVRTWSSSSSPLPPCQKTLGIILHTELGLVSEQYLTPANIDVQQLNSFESHGVLRSKACTLLACVHRGHPDEGYFGLFGLTFSGYQKIYIYRWVTLYNLFRWAVSITYRSPFIHLVYYWSLL